MDERFAELADAMKQIGGVSRVEMESFPSGVVFITVWVAERCFGLTYHPQSGADVYDVAEQTFNAGPSEHFRSIDRAEARLRDLVQASLLLPRTAAS